MKKIFQKIAREFFRNTRGGEVNNVSFLKNIVKRKFTDETSRTLINFSRTKDLVASMREDKDLAYDIWEAIKNDCHQFLKDICINCNCGANPCAETDIVLRYYEILAEINVDNFIVVGFTVD